MAENSKWGAKEFPFRRFLSCANYGTQVVGEEKFKQLLSGEKRRHVHYRCSRKIDPNCREPYVKEEIITEELTKLAGELLPSTDHCELGLLKDISKFTFIIQTANADYSEEKLRKANIKYLLQQRSEFEKTRLVCNLCLQLALRDRQLVAI